MRNPPYPMAPENPALLLFGRGFRLAKAIFAVRKSRIRWRYADTTGRWRIKMATGWERKAREEVEALLSRSAQMDSKKINHTRKA